MIANIFVLQAHDGPNRLPDPFGCGLDFPVPEMGIAQRHTHIVVAEQPGYNRHGYAPHHRVAGKRMAEVVKADILDVGLAADPMPERKGGCCGRNAGYPTPPAQIPASPLGHGAPTSGI